jgi:hypothetical protein
MFNETASIVVMMPDTRWGLVDRYSFERLASDPDRRILKKSVHFLTQLPIFDPVNDLDQTTIQRDHLHCDVAR